MVQFSEGGGKTASVYGTVIETSTKFSKISIVLVSPS